MAHIRTIIDPYLHPNGDLNATKELTQYLFSIIFLSTLLTLAWADIAVTKRVDRYGFLQGVLLQSKDLSFRVNTHGYLESVTPNDPKQEA